MALKHLFHFFLRSLNTPLLSTRMRWDDVVVAEPKLQIFSCNISHFWCYQSKWKCRHVTITMDESRRQIICYLHCERLIRLVEQSRVRTHALDIHVPLMNGKFLRHVVGVTMNVALILIKKLLFVLRFSLNICLGRVSLANFSIEFYFFRKN